MSNFSRFQDRMLKRKVAQNKINTSFIFNGYPSTEIIGDQNQTIQACVVNKQEKKQAYIYTNLNDRLQIGSVWMAKSLPLLIVEEIVTIKDVGWNKYYSLICNVQIDGHWGYFIGPEERAINISIKEEVMINSQQKPLLVMSAHGLKLDFEDKIIIKGRAWIVSEYDDISSNDVIYYTLRPSTVSKNETKMRNSLSAVEKAVSPEIRVGTPEIDNGIVKIGHNQQITLTTEDGYFSSSSNKIQILKRTSSTIIFTIPYGVKEEVIIYIKEKGDIVSKTYQGV